MTMSHTAVGIGIIVMTGHRPTAVRRAGQTTSLLLRCLDSFKSQNNAIVKINFQSHTGLVSFLLKNTAV